ncbi:MAG: zinc-ribbon domain-containing protein, partial [Candidatus Thermoplasmatota archaeon]
TNQFLEKISRMSAYGIIGNILYLIAFIIPYKRIKNGELLPVLPGHLKRCMNCGKAVPSGSIVCPYCGSRFYEKKNVDTISTEEPYELSKNEERR